MPRIPYTGIADAKMPEAVPQDRYDLRCVKATYNERSKSSGRPNVELQCEILGQPAASTLYHYITFPTNEDARKDNGIRANTKRICELFGVDFDLDGFDSEDFQGKEAHNVLLTVETDDKGRSSNRIDLRNT